MSHQESIGAQTTKTNQRSSATDYGRPAKLVRCSIATASTVRIRSFHDRNVQVTDSLRRTDAVPKKRGPKTDVLEALLKRVNGLEKRLKDEGKEPDDNGVEIVAESVRDAVDKKPSKNAISPPNPSPPTAEPQIPPPQQQSRPPPPQRHPSIGFPEQFVR